MNKPFRPHDFVEPEAHKSASELLRGFKSGISYRTLEPRIAFDGAMAASAAATAPDQQQLAAAAAAKPATGEPAVADKSVAAATDAIAHDAAVSGAHTLADASNTLAHAIGRWPNRQRWPTL